MYKAKLLLASTLVVLAVSVVAAASASATTQFEVGGTQISDELEKEPTVSENLLLKAEKEPEIECKKIVLEKGVITNDSPEATFKSIHFAGCVDKSEEACKVPTIETGEMKDTLELDGKGAETDEKFEPKSGGKEKEIAKFKLEGKGCKETNELKLEGAFDSKKEENDTKEDDHHLDFEVKPESGELKYGDQPFPALLMLRFTWALPVPWVLA